MAGRLTLAAVLLLSINVSVFGMPAWYQCNAQNCVPPGCVCASNAAPGGLTPAQTPQFILITHDDAVNAFSNKVMRGITDGHTNPNGCNVPATWYTLQDGTDCAVAKTLWEQNHEIALHTVHHPPLVPNFNGDLKTEMLGVRTWLNTTCGIPLDEMVGYRMPYLVNNPATRTVLKEAGLWYDSTMIEVFASESSPGPGQRVFPFTMDQGIPVNCQWNYPDGQCNQQTETYPGLMEVPMWELQDAAATHIATMDPEGDIYSLFVDNFNMNYNGNRAPLGIFLHAPWFNADNTAQVNKFLDWALAQKDVWVVTTKQLVEWMRAPVPADQMSTWVKCRPVDLTNIPGEKPCQQYTVSAGDTSYSIAIKFAVLTDDLLALNPSIGDGSRLQIGQQLRIPPWDDTCVGSAIINVSGPGDAAGAAAPGAAPVAAAPAAPTPAASAPSTTTTTTTTTTTPVPVMDTTMAVDLNNPTSGVNITMRLLGRTVTAFQTDLKRPFTSAIARGLGVDPVALRFLTVAVEVPAGTTTTTTQPAGYGRRLQQDTAGAALGGATAAGLGAAGTQTNQVVVVGMRVASGDPVSTYNNASAVLKKGGEFETQVLSTYSLALVADPAFVVFKDGAVINPATGSGSGTSTAPSSSSDDSSDSGLSTGAIAGIAAGGAVVLIAAVVATVMIVKKKKKNTGDYGSENPSEAGSSPVFKGEEKV